jgi:hypothetical protein
LLFFSPIFSFPSQHFSNLRKNQHQLHIKELITKQENAGAIPSNAIFVYHFSLEKYNSTFSRYDPKQLQANCCFEGEVCVGFPDCGLNKKLVWQIFRN